MSNAAFTDFSGGEISPKLFGRSDLKIYYRSGRRIENFVVEGTGTAHFREGTIYAYKTKSNKKAFIYTFNYNDLISFVMEFTEGFIRFYRNNGLVKHTSQAITGITQANPAVVTYDGADTYADGDSVYLSDIVGMTELNGAEYVVSNLNTGANTFELTGVDSTLYTAYASGGIVEEIVQVATPYLEAELFDLKFAQSSNKLYIAHNLHNPQILTYTSATSWAIAAHSPTVESFSVRQSISGITQASTAVLTYVGGDNFANDTEVIITGVSGMTEVNDERFIVKNLNTSAKTFELYDPDTITAIDSTAYEAYSSGGILRGIIESAAPFLTANNYPAAVGVYEERLIYGGTINNPLTIFGSRSAELDDFTVGVEVDDGIQYTIAGGSGSVLWLEGTENFLAAGTDGDVLKITGGVDGVITPTSISVRPTNSFGAASINPISRGTNIYYAQSNKKVLRSFEYMLEKDSYVPVDKNQVSDHILADGVTQISNQEARPSVVWNVRSDGQAALLTLEETESLSGWSRFVTDGLVISATNLTRENEYDQQWFCIKRTIDGEDVHYIEYQADRTIFPKQEDYFSFDLTEDQIKTKWAHVLYEKMKQYIHVDSAITYNGSVTGADITPAAITGSDITFTASTSIFVAGDVDRQIWKKAITGEEFGRAEITTYTSGTEVECLILEDFDSTDLISDGNWYFTSDTFSGADHLDGEVCVVAADGGQHSNITVTDGVVTLDQQVSVAHVGKRFIGYLEPNDIEIPLASGSSQTKKKVVRALGIRLLDSLFMKWGQSYYKLDSVDFRTAPMLMDRPPELFTGDRYQKSNNQVNDTIDGGWKRSNRIICVQDQPFPCNIQSLIPYIKATDK